MDQAAYFRQMRERRRQEILDMAKEMFLTEDPKSFTMQKLADRLDISTVTLYKYFKNSDDIIREIVRTILKNDRQFLMQVSEKEDPLENLLDTLEEFFRRMHENRKENALLFLFDAYTRQTEASRTNPEFERYMEDKIRQGQKAGEIRTDKTAEELWAYISQTNLAVIQHVSLLAEEEYQKSRENIGRWTAMLLDSYRVYLCV